MRRYDIGLRRMSTGVFVPDGPRADCILASAKVLEAKKLGRRRLCCCSLTRFVTSIKAFFSLKTREKAANPDGFQSIEVDPGGVY
jgi:hypothetical protein